jgi:GT2 family glycosyltransferase
MDIAILLTCHNRREKTSSCLQSLRNQTDLGAEIQLKVFLVDDGCTDGTAQAALAIWPETTVIPGSGNLYWCGGMRRAWHTAALSSPDYYLLLNDDTVLFPNGISGLLKLCPTPESRIIAVGATSDPMTGQWTYGGLECDTPFNSNSASPRRCKSMNANCALVPRAVFAEIGMFHRAYTHAMGDMDYGFTATNNGVVILETPYFVGQCRCNTPIVQTWRDNTLPRMVRLRMLISPKGLPPKEWMIYCRRNWGRKWLQYWLSPYCKILLGR